MKVLVTGCAGFIGSHICVELLRLGHFVVGVDSLIGGLTSNMSSFIDHGSFLFVQRDISKPWLDVDLPEGITHICHQAAIGSVPRSIENPTAAMESNVIGFHNVLEVARFRKIKRVVYASSSSVHGMKSPYAMTKRMNEMQAQQYRMHYGIETIGLRYFNVFGSRQRADSAYAAVIPKWINALHNNKPLTLFGVGDQSRDFTYVKNVVEANIVALTCENPLAFGKAFDIGCGRSATLKYLGYKLGELFGRKVEWDSQPERAGDVIYSKADLELTQKVLGWRPWFDLEAGLSDWLVKNASSVQHERER